MRSFHHVAAVTKQASFFDRSHLRRTQLSELRAQRSHVGCKSASIQQLEQQIQRTYEGNGKLNNPETNKHKTKETRNKAKRNRKGEKEQKRIQQIPLTHTSSYMK